MNNNALYRRARFMTTAPSAAYFPDDIGYEIAFAGRSNAGKSSAINTLCDQKSLARTSKTPGRTQALNFFELSDERRLVDLPGYGYAKVSVNMQKSWQALVASYLEQRECLRGLVIVMDIRRPLNDYDWQLLELCEGYGLPQHVLLTKADKLKRGRMTETVREAKASLREAGVRASAQAFSALKKTGIEEVCKVMDTWLEVETIENTNP